LGKWWGRKPLILIRAPILGMLMPASSNPQKDRDKTKTGALEHPFFT
jgi:adenine-specific DNA methylase